MKFTMICIAWDSPLVSRLREIVSVDPRLELRIYHQPGNHWADPHFEGWGSIGDKTFYHLFAGADVSRAEIWEIADALSAEMK